MIRIRKSAVYLSYPLLIIASFFLHYLLRNHGFGILISTYFPVVLAALAMCGLEYFIPHRESWSADSSEIKTDLMYMGLIQILLPKFLSFFFTITLIAYLQSINLGILGLWPENYPVYVQVLIMLLGADFLRYWLHVASHKWSVLWKLHSVHHSPSKLYWINVARFHPIEKILQFQLDALPFIVLGVSQEVVSLYFIFYAVNGFFQHSNIELKLGFLNYIVSGPELHRWHHSALVRESNQNYGNNLIVWDLLFGTRYLPEKTEVSELGLENKDFPQDFANQIKAPFVNK